MDLGVIIGVVIGLVVLVIGIVIVNDIIAGHNWGTGTIKTIMDNVPILLAIGGLVLAVGWAAMR